jgi:hypothetical protein
VLHTRTTQKEVNKKTKTKNPSLFTLQQFSAAAQPFFRDARSLAHCLALSLSVSLPQPCLPLSLLRSHDLRRSGSLSLSPARRRRSLPLVSRHSLSRSPIAALSPAHRPPLSLRPQLSALRSLSVSLSNL